MGPTWGQQDPGGPHVGPMNLAIWEGFSGDDLPLLTAPEDVIMTAFTATSND